MNAVLIVWSILAPFVAAAVGIVVGRRITERHALEKRRMRLEKRAVRANQTNAQLRLLRGDNPRVKDAVFRSASKRDYPKEE